ncbi:hypothetical protein EOL94_03180 [bacterium]|nr:hypothetical protein [bacterium]
MKTKIIYWHKKNLILWLLIAFVFNFVFFSAPILAEESIDENDNNFSISLPLLLKSTKEVFANSELENDLKQNHLPENKDREYEVTRTLNIPVTAYNTGDVNQCWGDPCISANGENICLALEKGYKRCAANFVPLGTRLRVEGVGECLVTDRMNSRYYYRVDIAMKVTEKTEAREFGLQNLKVEVLK